MRAIDDLERAVVAAFGIPGPMLAPGNRSAEMDLLNKMISFGYFTLPVGGLDREAILNWVPASAGEGDPAAWCAQSCADAPAQGTDGEAWPALSA